MGSLLIGATCFKDTMINYILTKYYYYKYLWTIKKSTGSLNAIKAIENSNNPHKFLKEQKNAEIELNRARTVKNPLLSDLSIGQVISLKKDH